MNTYKNRPAEPSEACIIWMHGLGADASDMLGLAQELKTTHAFTHCSLAARRRPVTINGGMVMPAWYDIVGSKLTDREDIQGVQQSQAEIDGVIDEQIAAGFKAEQIFLAGFSQGGAMALYTSLHSRHKLAGVIALSAYLPLSNSIEKVLPLNTPFFLGQGIYDPVVLPQWSAASALWLKNAGYSNLSIHNYPMEHSVCMDELKDISAWLDKTFTGAAV